MLSLHRSTTRSNPLKKLMVTGCCKTYIRRALLASLSNEPRAPDIYRDITAFMGERSSQKSMGSSSFSLLKSVHAYGEDYDNFRDEAFCQILKQISGNDNTKSVLQAGALMVVEVSSVLSEACPLPPILDLPREKIPLDTTAAPRAAGSRTVRPIPSSRLPKMETPAEHRAGHECQDRSQYRTAPPAHRARLNVFGPRHAHPPTPAARDPRRPPQLKS